MPFSREPPFDSARLHRAWQWLGLEGVVLLAALVCDLLIVFPAALDSAGPRGRDLLLLPGIFAICGCALWARKRPAAAAFAASGVLVVSTMFIDATNASAYSTLLGNLSLSETVSGVELAFFCVSRSSPPVAFLAVPSLVLTALFAVFRRPPYHHDLPSTLIVGVVLLVAVVVSGLHFRKADRPTEPRGLAGLLRSNWLLTGALCLPLFLDLYRLLTMGILGVPLALCAVAAAAVALLATRYPLTAGLGLAVVVLVAAPASLFMAPDHGFAVTELPLLTEVLAGMVTVVQLVRKVPPGRSWPIIAILSASVAFTSTVGVLSDPRRAVANLGNLFFSAVLLLGISVATGLFLRARDSERARVVEAAVTEAQTSERMALARELHDVVAHHVTGIVVQAQAAKMMGEQNPELALKALGQIEEAGADALTAMRRLVRSMRSHAEDDTQQATTDLSADLRRLVDAGHHGVRTEVDLRLPGAVPHEVGRSALRLVQESLTNVGKHATDPTCVRVLAEIVGGELHLAVQDDGKAGEPPPGERHERWRSGGYGLVGMRERVELLHGRLVAGPVPGGWLVEAWLPLAETAAQ